MGEMQEICQKLLDFQSDGDIEEAKLIVSCSLHLPIRSLPVEILCRISRMCNPYNPHNILLPSYWVEFASTGETSLGEPSLWTRPHVWFPYGSTY